MLHAPDFVQGSQACSYDPFCLGVCEWTDCPSSGLDGVKTRTKMPSPRPFTEQQPSTSSIQPLPPTEHFQFVDKKSLLELAKGYTPANTSRSTKWTLKVFELWCQARFKHKPEADVPHDLPYTRKYWRSLNLAVCPQTVYLRI